MKERLKRKKRFIHPSSQLKYIAIGTVPAIVMSLFCTVIMSTSGKLVFRTDKENVLGQIASIDQTLYAFEKEEDYEGTTENIMTLKKQFHGLKGSLQMTFLDVPEAWDQARRGILMALLFVVVCTGVLALLHSHKMAGAVHRMRNCVDMFTKGKDSSEIKLRKNDEFKDLAESLERLRAALINRGVIEA